MPTALTRLLEPVFLITINRGTADGDYNRLFGLDADTLISIGFILANVIIFAFIFTKILYRPLTNLMKKRTDKIKGQLQTAEENMANANEMKAEYEKKLAAIEAERTKILDAAYKQAEDSSHRKLEEVKQEAKLIVERAEKDAVSEIERMKNEVKQHIVEVSSLMAGKFVAASMDGETQNKLFDSALNELERTTWPN